MGKKAKKKDLDEEWIKIEDKEEIKKIKKDDVRALVYMSIAFLFVALAYVLRMIQLIDIMKDSTDTFYKVAYGLLMIFFTLIFILMFSFYSISWKCNLWKKYQGTLWKTKGVVKEKNNDIFYSYDVYCRAFGEKGNYTHRFQSDRYDSEIGDMVTVVGCEKDKGFEIFTLYKSVDDYGSRGEMLSIMNVFIGLGILVFCPWTSRFGISSIYCIILKIITCIIFIIVNFYAGIFEKNKGAIIQMSLKRYPTKSVFPNVGRWNKGRFYHSTHA